MTEDRVRELRLPQLGEGLREARIVGLLQEPGAPFRRGDPIYVIETDKTTIELEAPFDGRLKEWRVSTGDVISIDAVVATVVTKGIGKDGVSISARSERLIPPRTRAHARERGISDDVLAKLPSASNKVMPADVDEFLARGTERNSNGFAFHEYQVEGNQRALIFRLRRSATLVVPGTIALEIPWNWLELRRGGSGPLRPSAFQVFAHAVAHVANAHPRFRSVMLGDARVREYNHVNIGIAISRGDDDLFIAVVRSAEEMSIQEFIRACRVQMRGLVANRRNAMDDAQILLSYLGEFGIRRGIPTLVAPASSILFLGARYPETGMAEIVLTFDHRLINGKGAARFLRDVVKQLETPSLSSHKASASFRKL